MSSPFVLFLDVLPADADRTPAELAETIRRFAPEDTPLTIDDLGVSRGDGVFETIGVFDGAAHAVEPHLRRLEQSAAMMDLPVPHRAQLRSAIVRAVAELPRGTASLKLVLTRGREGGTRPSAWIVATPIPQGFPERESGVRVALLDRGLASDVAARAPWLLVGAKSLSYAVNMAALREARRRGADDVIFTSTDGFVLEGPTSSLVVRRGEQFLTTPSSAGILAGTTQADLFAALRDAGHDVEERLLRPEELRGAEGIWLLSSVRLAVPVTQIDGEAVPFSVEETARLNALLLARDGLAPGVLPGSDTSE